MNWRIGTRCAVELVWSSTWETRGYVRHYRNCGGDRGHRRRLPDGARKSDSAAAAGGIADYWRSRGRDGADRESSIHPEEDSWRPGRCVGRFALHEREVP